MQTTNILTLASLSEGESAFVLSLKSESAMRRRLMDIGLIEGTHVTCLKRAPFGDPAAYLIRGAVIAIRSKDAAEVILSKTNQSEVRL